MYRFYEILPGALAWGTLLAMVFGSRYVPTAAAYFIILFDTYWLLKSLYLSFHLRITFKQMRANLKINWLEKLNELEDNANATNKVRMPRIRSVTSQHSGSAFADSDYAPNWRGIRHLVILPMYKEPYEVVRESFETLAAVSYPKENMLVVVALEERAGEAAKKVGERIAQEYGSRFGKFLVTVHPANMPGDLPGKGSNEAWAGREAKRLLIDPLRLDYDTTIVSVFDVDTQVFPEYFSRLAYVFLKSKNRLRAVYQPVPLFTNNIYQAPAVARVIAFSTTFWQMMQQSRPERLTSFSSQSLPFRAVVDIGFWDPGVVSEDSRIFWQGFLRYNGDFRVEPLFYPVSMDVNTAPTFFRTLVNLYKQHRRWGWGAENIPYILEGFRKNPSIPRRKRWYWTWNAIEGFHSWATNSIMIFALGWLPVVLGGHAFRATLLSYNLPTVTRWIVTISMAGIAASAVMGLMLLPPQPEGFKRKNYFMHLLQWLLTPLTLIVFGAFPALEAQTRLMLGGKWRLGFWATPKMRDR